MFLQNIFRDDAKWLYVNSVEPHTQYFEHAIRLIGRDSVIHQNRAKNVLHDLRLCTQLGDDGDKGG